jgi:hypothetical protein
MRWSKAWRRRGKDDVRDVVGAMMRAPDAQGAGTRKSPTRWEICNVGKRLFRQEVYRTGCAHRISI